MDIHDRSIERQCSNCETCSRDLYCKRCFNRNAEKERERTIENCAKKVVEFCEDPFSAEDMPHPETIAEAIRSLK